MKTFVDARADGFWAILDTVRCKIVRIYPAATDESIVQEVTDCLNYDEDEAIFCEFA